MIRNKKGAEFSEEIIVFILLNVAFFAIMLFFVAQKTDNGLLYEQAYAKKIAFFIDSAKPGMIISIQAKDLLEAAKKLNANLANVISIDSANNRVVVSLANVQGYGAKYFSNYNVEVKRGLDLGDTIILQVK